MFSPIAIDQLKKAQHVNQEQDLVKTLLLIYFKHHPNAIGDDIVRAELKSQVHKQDLSDGIVRLKRNAWTEAVNKQYGNPELTRQYKLTRRGLILAQQYDRER